MELSTRMLPILIAVVLAMGCGAKAVDIAQTALSTTARGFVQVDNSTAPAHDRARQAAVEECEGWACYDEHTAGWNTLEESLRAGRSFLTAAQAGVDAWREGESDERGFGDLAACVLDGVVDIIAALEVLGLDVPELVTGAVSLLGGFTGTCPENVGPQPEPNPEPQSKSDHLEMILD